MIRRSVPGAAEWLLIPQGEHARLSGELAAAWNMPEFGRLDPYQPLLYAIAHHDDGWPEWEQSPGVDSGGRPVNFDEMPTLDSLSIWRRSIDRCAAHHPVAGHAVAGHFMALLRRFNAWRHGADEARFAAETFLDDYARKTADWLAAWPGSSAAAQAAADHAVAVLQLFDALSLWLCCQPRTDAAKFVYPGAGRIELKPLSERDFVVSPWPFQKDELLLALPAWRIPQRSFASPEELARAMAATATIDWRLRR